VEDAARIRLDLDGAVRDEIGKTADSSCRRLRLRETPDAQRDGLDSAGSESRAVAASDGAVGFEACADRLGLLEPTSDLVKGWAIDVADEDADLLERFKLVGDGLEAGDEEVADGDIGPDGAAEHLAQAFEEGRIGGGVKDVHAPSSSGSGRPGGDFRP